MAHLLGGEHLHVEFPAKVVLDDVTVGIDGGDRIGIVGRNGDGKSTLMKVLTGRLDPDAGRVTLRGGVRVGMLAQDDDLPDDETVRHAIVGDRPEHEWLGDARVRDVLDGLLRDVPLDTVVAVAVGRSAPPRGARPPARRRVGRGRARRAHEPPRRRGRRVARRAPRPSDGRATPAACCSSRTTAGSWMRCARGCGRCTTAPSIRSRAATRPTCCSASSASGSRTLAETKRRNILRKELAWLRRGAPARTSKPKFRIDAATQLIEDEPPPRDNVELAKLATARLGKDVVDLLDAGVSTIPARTAAPSGSRC